MSTDPVISPTGSPFLGRPGAVAGDGIDLGVAAHYGNPLGEQRVLAGGLAIVDLSHRAVLSVTGPDRLSWIDSITSQRVARLAPGESSETLQLDTNGRVEFAVRLLDDGETLWLMVEHDEAAGLLAWLGSMRFMLRVELADRSADFATVGTFSAQEPSDSSVELTATLVPFAGLLSPLPVAVQNGVPLVWRDPWTSVTQGGHQYAVAPDGHPGETWTYSEVLVPRAELVSLVASAVPVAGLLALEALRIAAWRPRFATEVDEKSIPHELDWLRSAVHLNKGCYRGQETVAKVHNLGHPPRRLVMLHLDGSDAVLPSHGDEVLLQNDGSDAGSGVGVGVVTSVARHYELGPIALAVIKRSTDPTAGLIVRADGVDIPAAQEIIVPPDAGAEAKVPRLPRLGAVHR